MEKLAGLKLKTDFDLRTAEEREARRKPPIWPKENTPCYAYRDTKCYEIRLAPGV